MNSILIVEDDNVQRKDLISIAKNCNSNIRIFHTESIETAYTISENHEIGAFFVDILLVDGTGIEFAKKIRSIKRYQFTPIIFITGVPTKEMEAFHDIHCYDYILKPYTEESVKKIMNKILVDYFEQITDHDKYLDLEFRGIKQRINTKDILLIESKNRKIFIRTKYEEIRYRHMNLSQFIKELPDNFIQIHQSIVVNPIYIEKIDKTNNQLYMKNIKEIVPIGTSFKKRVGELINGIL